MNECLSDREGMSLLRTWWITGALGLPAACQRDVRATRSPLESCAQRPLTPHPLFKEAICISPALLLPSHPF